jgi:hypothetical protein
MTTETPRSEEASGLRFVGFLIGGIVAATLALLVAVAIWGHFAAPDPGLF